MKVKYINYTEMVSMIKQTELFDLYRLSVMISHELGNPERIQTVRSIFKEGDMVSYLDTNSNRLEQARVLQKNPKYVLVENIGDHKKWNIRYCALNLKNIDINLYLYSNSSKEKLAKSGLRVGEVVGFTMDGTQIVGVITRLNYKTVTIITKDNHRWRVSYSYLFKIIDADLVNQFDPGQIAIWVQNENNSESDENNENNEQDGKE